MNTLLAAYLALYLKGTCLLVGRRLLGLMRPYARHNLILIIYNLRLALLHLRQVQLQLLDKEFLLKHVHCILLIDALVLGRESVCYLRVHISTIKSIKF